MATTQITADMVKALRADTDAGVMDCRRALEQADGDMQKAKAILREKGIASAGKKAERETKQGLVEAYIHGGRIGALVEVNCETDFVARTDQFKQLARELAMHVMAKNPRFLTKDEATDEFRQREQYTEQQLDAMSLMSQAYVRDESKTIEQLIKETIATTGENIRIGRFARFELGK
ncbi:MAG: translation elongation factor Ts [Chloroflexota bacterium]